MIGFSVLPFCILLLQQILITQLLRALQFFIELCRSSKLVFIEVLLLENDESNKKKDNSKILLQLKFVQEAASNSCRGKSRQRVLPPSTPGISSKSLYFYL
ncbi:hypothetical protein KFK09_025408 [Dendrobium nobile]|uniref:Uncharacterized protein n=1 Tax=Dendrobium nobile TaxID=94219 RepID=A0A8T3AGH5_DENNO|nr:hypothetical protein KFK09_025408 [Dendrobium nobile]